MTCAPSGLPSAPAYRDGFSLLELLVAIAISAILLAIALPAVHSIRERSRITHCQSNLKQIALAAHQYESSHGRLPSGGWGYNWQGFSDIGGQLGQPGSWFYSLLPWLEQESLYDLGRFHSAPIRRSRDLRKRVQTPVAILNCPSRRDGSQMGFDDHCDSCPSPIGFMGALERTFRVDYAINAGDSDVDENSPQRWPIDFSGPPNLESTFDRTGGMKFPPPPEDWSGISWLNTAVELPAIADGLSNTLMVGEKYISADAYYTGADWGDNEPAFGGFNNDNHRSTHPDWRFRQDRIGEQSVGSFGSAHMSGANVAFCDGSTRHIAYSIAPEIFRSLGNRKDGNSTQ